MFAARRSLNRRATAPPAAHWRSFADLGVNVILMTRALAGVWVVRAQDLAAVTDRAEVGRIRAVNGLPSEKVVHVVEEFSRSGRIVDIQPEMGLHVDRPCVARCRP